MIHKKLLSILVFFSFFVTTSVHSYENELNLNLDKALEIAESNNLELKYYFKELESKSFLKTQYSSAYLPQVDMTLVYPFVGRSSSVNFTQILYDFGKLNKRVVSGGFGIKAIEYNIATRKKELFNSITENYYEILKVKNEILRVNKDIETRKDVLAKTEAFLQAGRASRIDVTEKNIDLSESELEIIQLQGDLLKLEEDLFNLLGIEKPYLVTYESSLNYRRINVDESQILESKSFNDPAVKEIEMAILSQKALISAYKRDFLPSLIAGGAYRFEGKGVAEEDKKYDFIIGLGMRWEIFSGGKTMGQIKEAESRISALEAKLKFTKRQMKSTIKYGIIDLDTAFYKIDVYKKSLKSAQINYDFNKTKYETGEASRVDLEEAERLLQEQKVNYENAVFSYLIKTARFEKLLGLTLNEKN